MSNVYVSSGCFRTNSPHELIRLARDSGITHLELSSGMAFRPDFLEPILEAASEFSYLVHNYFPPPANPFVLNLASAQNEMLVRSKAMVKSGIDLSVEFGASFYSVHAGFGIDLRPEDLGKPEIQAALPADRIVSRDRAYDILCETVSELVIYAAERNIKLLLENNVVTDLNVSASPMDMLWMATPEEFSDLVKDINHPMLGILLDFGHLAVSAQALGFDRMSFISKLETVIGCLHLSENDGKRDTNQPIRNDSWLMPLLRAFTHIPWVIEAYKLPIQQIHEQIAIAEQFHQE